MLTDKSRPSKEEIRLLDQIDAGHHLEQFTGEMARAADAGRRDTPGVQADSLRTGNSTGNFQFFVSFRRGVQRAGVPACAAWAGPGPAFVRPGERRELPSRILPALAAGPRRRRPGCGRAGLAPVR